MNMEDRIVRRNMRDDKNKEKSWRGKMKSIKLIGAVLLVMLAVSASVWCQESGLGKNDYGIVAGQIIDPETGKPVNERFFIRFNYVLYKGEYPTESNGLIIPPAYPIPDVRFSNLPGRMGYSLITDSKGYFKRKFAPGTYGIILAPENHDSSRYCVEMDPMDPKMSAEDKKKLSFIGSLSICVGNVFGISFLQYRQEEDNRWTKSSCSLWRWA